MHIDAKRESGRQRQRRHLLAHPARGREAVKRYSLAHPERIREKDKRADPVKVKARRILNKAIAAGKITRGLCWCGELGEAHHENYDKPLNVTWICSLHHARKHKLLG